INLKEYSAFRLGQLKRAFVLYRGNSGLNRLLGQQSTMHFDRRQFQRLLHICRRELSCLLQTAALQPLCRKRGGSDGTATAISLETAILNLALLRYLELDANQGPGFVTSRFPCTYVSITAVHDTHMTRVQEMLHDSVTIYHCANCSEAGSLHKGEMARNCSTTRRMAAIVSSISCSVVKRPRLKRRELCAN